jgi:hypothetical protein
MKAMCVLIVAGLSSAAVAQDNPDLVAGALGKAATAPKADCKSADPKAVVVCGRSQQRFRIDPAVLAATRAAEAPPPKPALDATAGQPCTGSQCGGGSYVPLVGMALKALKAAELAADGDDWRDAFRTRPDQYQTYQANKAKKGGVSVGVTVGKH